MEGLITEILFDGSITGGLISWGGDFEPGFYSIIKKRDAVFGDQ